MLFLPEADNLFHLLRLDGERYEVPAHTVDDLLENELIDLALTCTAPVSNLLSVLVQVPE